MGKEQAPTHKGAEGSKEKMAPRVRNQHSKIKSQQVCPLGPYSRRIRPRDVI